MSSARNECSDKRKWCSNDLGYASSVKTSAYGLDWLVRARACGLGYLFVPRAIQGLLCLICHLRLDYVVRRELLSPVEAPRPVLPGVLLW